MEAKDLYETPHTHKDSQKGPKRIKSGKEGNDQQGENENQQAFKQLDRCRQILNTLACAHCSVLPRTHMHIYQCDDAHILCGDCYMRAYSNFPCPHCRTRPLKRDLLSEKMARLAGGHHQTICRYQHNGCITQDFLGNMPKHERECIFQDIKCPNETCPRYTPWAKLSSHIENENCGVLQYGDGQGMYWGTITNQTLCRTPGYPKDALCGPWQPIILLPHQDATTFIYLTLYRNQTGVWTFLLRQVGDEPIRQQTKIQLEISTTVVPDHGQSKPTHIWTGHAGIHNQGNETAADDSQSLSIVDSCIKQMYNPLDNTMFRYKIRIDNQTYKPTPEQADAGILPRNPPDKTNKVSTAQSNTSRLTYAVQEALQETKADTTPRPRSPLLYSQAPDMHALDRRRHWWTTKSPGIPLPGIEQDITELENLILDAQTEWMTNISWPLTEKKPLTDEQSDAITTDIASVITLWTQQKVAIQQWERANFQIEQQVTVQLQFLYRGAETPKFGAHISQGAWTTCYDTPIPKTVEPQPTLAPTATATAVIPQDETLTTPPSTPYSECGINSLLPTSDRPTSDSATTTKQAPLPQPRGPPSLERESLTRDEERELQRLRRVEYRNSKSEDYETPGTFEAGSNPPRGSPPPRTMLFVRPRDLFISKPHLPKPRRQGISTVARNISFYGDGPNHGTPSGSDDNSTHGDSSELESTTNIETPILR